jgi:citrate lyase subunit beta/citryl-CoA lyase
MLPRSYLFVPGNRPERFDKALASAAHAVILDLEDAVPPDQKDAARASIASWLSAARPVVVRINAAPTPWYDDDRAVCLHPGVAAVMVAKVEHADQLAALEGTVPLIPLIESAAGIDQVRSISRVRGVSRLAFGAIDLQLDLCMQAEYDELIYFRSQLVLASRLAGVGTPIDGPSVALHDSAQVELDARRARRLGFGAKLCIHPNQLEAVNRSFRPTEAEIGWAHRVLAIARASGGAAVALDGKMIDTPVILRAQAIVDDAGP